MQSCPPTTSVYRLCKAAKKVHAAPALPASICRPVARGQNRLQPERDRCRCLAGSPLAGALTSSGGQVRIQTECG